MAQPQKVVEFRSKAPHYAVHIDERAKTVGANRTVPVLVKAQFEPVGGRQEDYLKNGGRLVTSDEEVIDFLRKHTGNVANGGRDYQELVSSGKGIEDELKPPAALAEVNKKPSKR